MTARTLGISLDRQTAEALEALARYDDRTPPRIAVAALRLYLRLSVDAQAAYRRVENADRTGALSELTAELEQVCIRAGKRIPVAATLKDEAAPAVDVTSHRYSDGTAAAELPSVAKADADWPRAMSIRDFAKAHGIGRSTVYAELKDGRLQARKVGSRTVILKEDADRWLAGLRTR